MNRERLLQNPLPIDRVAARVVFKRGEHWAPRMNDADHMVLSATPLPMRDFPAAVPAEIRALVGRRRDRMVLLGLAHAPDKSKAKKAAWVARCDCGNYTHRTNVKRWLNIAEPDMCRECRCAFYIKNGITPGDDKDARRRWLARSAIAASGSQPEALAQMNESTIEGTDHD